MTSETSSINIFNVTKNALNKFPKNCISFNALNKFPKNCISFQHQRGGQLPASGYLQYDQTNMSKSTEHIFLRYEITAQQKQNILKK